MGGGGGDGGEVGGDGGGSGGSGGGSGGALVTLYAAYVLANGLGSSCIGTIAGPKLISSWFPASRGRVMGVVTAGNNFGGLLWVNVGAAVDEASGWRAVARTFSSLLAALAVAYFVLVRDGPPPPRRGGGGAGGGGGKPVAAAALGSVLSGGGAAAGDDEAAAAGVAAPASPADPADPPAAAASLTPRQALREPFFWSTALGVTMAYLTYPGVLAHWLAALRAEGFSAADAASAMSLVAVFGICSKLLAGFLSEKLTARVTMCLCMLVQVVALLLFAFGGGLGRAQFWLCSGLYGLGFGGIGASLPLLTIEAFGAAHFGKIYGMINLFFLLPAIGGPLLVGAAFDRTGSYSSGFAVCAGVFCAGIAALLLGPRRPTRRKAAPPGSVSVN